MEELISGIIFIIFILWLIATGIEWISSHPSDIAQHIGAWKELYALLAFLAYLVVIRALTQKAFSEAAHYEPRERRDSVFGAIGRIIARPVVFFLVTAFIWFRSQFLLTAFHYGHAHEWAPVALAAAFGLIFAFWPTSSLRSITYSALLAQLRALYLVVATMISLVSLTLAAVIALVIIALPIALYAALAYAVLHFTGGRINPSDTTHILIIIGGIAVFIMTARGTWNLGSYMLTTYAEGIRSAGLKCVHAWRGFCQAVYTPISRVPPRLGSFLGGDVA